MHQIALTTGLVLGLIQATIDAEPLPSPAAQAEQAASTEVEERYEVHLLTIDQGGLFWELFGHNALLIRDRATGEDLTWNWGLFDLSQEGFYVRLLRGTMFYTMGPARLEPFLDVYRASNRSVYANQVLLTQEEARELDRLVRLNYEPENRDYLYDYFFDNCSTRLRDMLDTVLGGELRERFAAVTTSRSFRWHVRRLVQGIPWIDYGMHILMGIRGDVRRTEWEEMFIPMEMARLLEGYERPIEGGGSRPLLGPRQVLFEADRPPTAQEAPAFSPLWLVFGILIGAGAIVFGSRARAGSPPARAGLAAIVGLWGLFSGLIGLLMIVGPFTEHEFADWNVNIFHLSPLSLPLAALALLALAGRQSTSADPGRGAVRLAILIAGLSLAASLVELTRLVNQANAEVLALGIPANLGVAVALILLTRASRRAT